MRSLVVFGAACVVLTGPWASPLGAKDIPSQPPADLTHMSCKGAPNEIKVIVRNVKRAEGLITADLFPNREENFLKKPGRVGRISVAARSPVTVFCLAAPSPTPHAVAVYQDRNANTKFDKTGIGLPAEPYGVSNNPRMRFGPPSAAESVFPVDANGSTIEISLKK
jgi:uncharacterized protein (DUF2141 family)